MEEMKEEEMEEKEMKEGEESNCNSRVLEFYRHVQIREKKKWRRDGNTTLVKARGEDDMPSDLCDGRSKDCQVKQLQFPGLPIFL